MNALPVYDHLRWAREIGGNLRSRGWVPTLALPEKIDPIPAPMAMLPPLHRKQYHDILTRMQDPAYSGWQIYSPARAGPSRYSADGLPKATRLVRALLAAQHHRQVDLRQCHLELVRALLPPAHPVFRACPLLDGVDAAREFVRRQFYPDPPPQVIKRFLSQILNAGVDTVRGALAAQGFQGGSELWQAVGTLRGVLPLIVRTICERLGLALNFFGAGPGMFALAAQAMESRVMLCVLEQVLLERPDSVIWLHDGLWVDRAVPHSQLIRAFQAGLGVAGVPQLNFAITELWDLLKQEIQRWSMLSIDTSRMDPDTLVDLLRIQALPSNSEEGLLGVEADVVALFTLSMTHRRPPRGLVVPSDLDHRLLHTYLEWLGRSDVQPYLYRESGD